MAGKLELTVGHDVTFWGHRVVIPEAASGRMLQILHKMHQGVSAMKAVVRTSAWWLVLDQEIERMSNKCDICVQVKAVTSSENAVPLTKKKLVPCSF